LLNKIPVASKPSVEVQNEWYISTLPSNTTIFVDRVAKPTLAENMKEAIVVEKPILALVKKNALEETKSKMVTFKDELKEKTPKDPFDLEDLQKVLRPFKRNPIFDPKPPNTISNAKLDLEEEEVSTNDDE